MKQLLLSLVAATSLSLANSNTEDLLTAPTQTPLSWRIFDSIHAKGDLRLRHEIIERDDKANKYRDRFRLRLFLNIDISDRLTFETALLTGKGNPTSGNVDFRDDENLADYFFDIFKLNLLNLTYRFDNAWVSLGKSPHNIYRPMRTQLIWDNDIRLEGLNYGYSDDTKSYRLGINRVHRLENEAQSDEDIYIYLAQYVQTLALDSAKLNLGGGFYYYDGVKGNAAPYAKGELGNSIDSFERYTNDYSIVEAFAELKVGDVMGKPFSIATTFAYNAAADEDNFGYDISMQLGKVKKLNDWQVGYTYRDVQKDAVFGAHNDSDFIAGGTDGKGHIITTRYRFANNVDLGGHFQWATLNEGKTATGLESDYHRVQLDVSLKF